MEATTMKECRLEDEGYKRMQAYNAARALRELQDKMPTAYKESSSTLEKQTLSVKGELLSTSYWQRGKFSLGERRARQPGKSHQNAFERQTASNHLRYQVGSTRHLSQLYRLSSRPDNSGYRWYCR